MILNKSDDHFVKHVERLMLNKFKEEPFHNLYFIYKTKPKGFNFGGTCSDKVLSFYKKLRDLKFETKLHSSVINNKEIHRLVSVTLNNKVYYADVGNGWPSIKLFPKDYEIEYKSYGMTYRSILKESSLEVYITRDNKKKLSVTIPFHSKTHEEIMQDIHNRFDQNIEYPFTGGIRFSQIIHDKFLFLRDDTLYIYSYDSAVKKIVGFEPGNLSETLKHNFNFDIASVF